jgi:glycosyltransferase involved in cell wall biosynthesis
MKVAFLVTSLANLGPTVATIRLIKSLNNDVEGELFYFKEKPEMSCPIKSRKISFFETINFDEFDIVHSTGLRPDIYLLKNHSKVKNKSITSVHCYIKEDLGFLYSKLVTRIVVPLWYATLKRMKRVVVSTEYMRNYYIEELGISNISKIPYGIDPLKDIPITEREIVFFDNLRSSYTVLGNVSLLIKRKGLEQLIPLLVKMKDLAVVIVGDGEERENLMKLVNENNLQDRFFILGFKENSYKYYKYFDAYIMPSRSEGFSLATLEAFYFNLPVVSTRLPYYEEFFNDDEICFFELDNLNSLVEATRKAIENKDKIISSANKVFESNFTLDSLRIRHLELYKTIINEKC